jgi:two-component system, NtrC family, sensor histidine kinase HydH
MEYESTVNCSDCLQLLIVDWGHSIEKKIESIQQNISSVRGDVSQFSNKEQINKLLDQIEKNVVELIHFPSPFVLEKVEINELIEHVVVKSRDFHQGIIFESIPSANSTNVIANKVWLRRLLYILVDNSIEAMKESVIKKVVISASIDEQKVVITISDTGKGISDTIIDNLFTDLPAIDHNGRGRGTYIAKLIADIYHGKVILINTTETGTKVSIFLPIAG